MQYIKSFLENEDGGISTLRGTPEWWVARQLVEKIEAEVEAAREVNANV